MGFGHCEPRRPHAAELTEREREVLRRIAHGQSTRQIAKGLAITPSTARTHAHNVLLKLGVHSRIQAVARAAPIPDPMPVPVPEPRDADPLGALTLREHEVLSCMVDGLTRASIADRLRLSPHTVRTHARNVLAKLGVHSTLEAAALVRGSADRADRRAVSHPT
jgi:DNA-binding NarL/FixJ family response regulator